MIIALKDFNIIPTFVAFIVAALAYGYTDIDVRSAVAVWATLLGCWFVLTLGIHFLQFLRH